MLNRMLPGRKFPYPKSLYAVEDTVRFFVKEATRLLVTADAGGSNGYRLRLWKQELQKLADEIGLEIAVCHFPPGTSKWNKIEHRLFSAITQNWRGKPLVSHETVVNLIAATTTRRGLRVRSELDTSDYPAGLRVSDADMETLYLRRDDFHGEWNYSLLPRQRLPLTEAVVS
jgi:Rhodopirellula transposase DDE domain